MSMNPEYLRRLIELDLDRENNMVERLCQQWNVIQHARSRAALKIAAVEDYTFYEKPLINEGEAARAFLFTHYFTLRYDFADIPEERMREVARIVRGPEDDWVRDDWGTPEGMETPASWYQYFAERLGLTDHPHWSDIDESIRYILAEIQFQENHDFALAKGLHDIIAVIRQG